MLVPRTKTQGVSKPPWRVSQLLPPLQPHRGPGLEARKGFPGRLPMLRARTVRANKTVIAPAPQNHVCLDQHCSALKRNRKGKLILFFLFLSHGAASTWSHSFALGLFSGVTRKPNLVPPHSRTLAQCQTRSKCGQIVETSFLSIVLRPSACTH